MSRLAQAVARGTEFGSSPLLLCLSIRRGHPGRTLSVTSLLLALGLGFVSGLRTFTPVAAVMLVRGSIWGIVMAIAAVAEYVWDVLPNTPSRTQARGLSARVVSGAFVGWMIATMHDGSGMFGAIAGIAGAVIGAYAGQAARLAAIARIGGYPAAIVEDLVAIGLAAFIFTREDPGHLIVEHPSAQPAVRRAPA